MLDIWSVTNIVKNITSLQGRSMRFWRCTHTGRKVREWKSLHSRGPGGILPWEIFQFRVSEILFPAFSAVVSFLFNPSLVLSVRYNIYGKNGKTMTPSNSLPGKGETSTLQTGKLCYNAININSLVLVCVCRIARGRHQRNAKNLAVIPI